MITLIKKQLFNDGKAIYLIGNEYYCIQIIKLS